jgi:hypothetical protein
LNFGSNQTSATFSSQTLGTPLSTDLYVLAVAIDGNDGGATVSASVGGVTLPLIQRQSGNTYIFAGTGVTSTTGSIVFNGQASGCCAAFENIGIAYGYVRGLSTPRLGLRDELHEQ